MKALILVLVAASAITTSLAGEAARLFVPLTPMAQTHSDGMMQRLGDLREQDVFSTLEKRTRLTGLPAWACIPEGREVAFVFPAPLAPGAFRYGVIIGRDGGLIVIRAGGLQDVYEVFEIEAVAPVRPDNDG